MILLVDCTTTTALGLVNYYYYVNASTKAVIGKVRNDMYVAFNVIWHRKIRLHTENGYHYLIRAYFAEHVDEHYSHNTYVEIISVNNPMKPWTIRVMDRSFLGQDKLSITDFEVYLGNIYILDYFSGVIQFDISPQQSILITGRYRTDSGFTKLGVYSNNLDNEFLLVLAHDHAIFEVDWSNHIKPVIVTKYTIPDGAWLHDLWVNDEYVVVQLTANLTVENAANITTQSTYVMTRGSRTYTSAYVALPHPSPRAFVDFNRDTSQFITIDTEKIELYALAAPILKIQPVDPSLAGKPFDFTVKGFSQNELNTSDSHVCTFTFSYTIVEANSTMMFPTGLKLPSTYYANFPGQLFIPLDRYVLGANITYKVIGDEKHKYPPEHYVFQQNDTRVFWWDKNGSIFKYTFLKTEQFDSFSDTVIWVYTQNINNDTYFSRCSTIPFTD